MQYQILIFLENGIGPESTESFAQALNVNDSLHYFPLFDGNDFGKGKDIIAGIFQDKEGRKKRALQYQVQLMVEKEKKKEAATTHVAPAPSKELKIESHAFLSGVKRTKSLGKGNFGEVYLGEWMGDMVALKTLQSGNVAAIEKEVNTFM